MRVLARGVPVSQSIDSNYSELYRRIAVSLSLLKFCLMCQQDREVELAWKLAGKGRNGGVVPPDCW